MKISRKSWHYKLQKKEHVFGAKSLCDYFWRTVWAMFSVSFDFVANFVALFVFTLGCYLLGPLFGFYPRKLTFPVLPHGFAILMQLNEDKQLAPRKPLFRFKEMPFYGYQLLLIGLAVYFISNFNLWPQILKVIAGFVLGTVVIVPLGWFLYIVFNKVRRTETWGLVKEYTKAVKNKICPLIEYID